MKKILSLTLVASMLMLSVGCTSDKKEKLSRSAEDTSAAVQRLVDGDKEYIKSNTNEAEITSEIRTDTAKNGQKPYAVVVTCSDSRVPPEHIFSAGLGELFVIRTAGNVVDDYEIGSVEYGVEHLGAKVVLVLGHTGCGAVKATVEGGAEGKIETIVEEIHKAIGNEKDMEKCVELNVENTKKKLSEDEGIKEKVKAGEVKVIGGIYDIETGEVKLLDN
ncbi:carbonic anhydrase [Clostridium cellulovorans]|uniref:carbonic anhydrase n=1 Tax=Clostridium cellulovorans (strain ATCC 35296 / DSM 3052 / OCM 3 / 743B) TaxID=573061 RepID=D9SR39_CLOC7|nr:carbonic anhydrase [Clostridium cellulovorans]ADL50327.1 carbonic anhydrase [Clostridium cellulovorans 743B]